MSTRPAGSDTSHLGRPRRPVTVRDLPSLKASGTPIVMVTAYDYPSGRAAEAAQVDIVLVGDSGAMTVLGHPSTVPATIDEMLMLTAAVRRGTSTVLLVADLPFGSYEVSDEQAVTSAIRFVKEAGAEAVKLEGGGPMSLQRAAAIVAAGIPVMGHVGLTPQTAAALGGYRAQGRSAESALEIARGALALQAAGCFAVVLEAIPSAVTTALKSRLDVPTIGIGAGPDTDGQVLVFHDLLGIRDGEGARFVKRYADLQEAMNSGVAAYAAEVRARTYPGAEHGYGIGEVELDRFVELLNGPSFGT
jgi:3-methyl-2-oxobutanoate hydroxymethyltransferase